MATHKSEIKQNLDGTWSYRCTGCNDKKDKLKSRSTGKLAFTTHIRALQHKTR